MNSLHWAFLFVSFFDLQRVTDFWNVDRFLRATCLHVSVEPVQVHPTLPPLPLRLIRSNLKSKIPDSTFSDGIACMFCMAVWIKDWLSLLLSCSNLCPLSLHEGSGEFPKQSGPTFPGRYRLRHFNKLKCKAKENIKSEWMRQPISRVIKFLERSGDAQWHVCTYSRGTDAVYTSIAFYINTYYFIRLFKPQDHISNSSYLSLVVFYFTLCHVIWIMIVLLQVEVKIL